MWRVQTAPGLDPGTSERLAKWAWLAGSCPVLATCIQLGEGSVASRRGSRLPLTHRTMSSITTERA